MLYYTPAQSAFLSRFVRVRRLFAALALFSCFVSPTNYRGDLQRNDNG